ncbi:MAG: BamA/TamA family outer membrane protein [Arcicella sp.]|jgi:outer membrane protein assembly factor BamA|nr:BamA/TamA family outer membrane protein [Arcicella sp.]
MLLFTLLFSFFTHHHQYAHTDSTLLIKQINISGNHKTNEKIILRELDFVAGDSIKQKDIEKKLDLTQRKLVNTNLFISVEVKSEQVAEKQIVINIKLLEQWYILGYPIFQIVDRNYAEWWQRGASLSRTTYGVNLLHNNFRGRAEKINLRLETGFTQRVDIAYQIPYIDKAQKTGIGFSVSYITNKNIAFKSLNDTLFFYKSETKMMRKRFTAAMYLRKRYGFYDTHTLELRYSNNSIDDTIARLNPSYFLDGRTAQKYAQLSYYFNYDFRDNVAYPLRGRRYEFFINKLGLLPSDDINQLDITGAYSWYKPLTKKLFYGVNLKAKISFPERQPFFNTRGLGYFGDLVRGYELYVVDGSSYFLARNNLRYQLLNSKIHLKFLKIKQFNTIPIGIYPNVFMDYGYVKNNYTVENNSRLANRSIYGGGFGLDLVTYYNLVVRFSYVMNDRQERNFVFNIGREF